jgi:outer membrane protein assembly factor BamB
MSHSRGGPTRRQHSYLVVVFAFVIAVGFILPTASLVGRANASPPAPPPARSVRAPVFVGGFHPTVVLNAKYDWPELHQTPLLTGYAANSGLSSSTASTLGVAWDTNLYGSALDSPVVAYDPALGETLAYVGTESGNVLAINLANGQIVWGVWLGTQIRSSPVVSDGAVFAGTYSNPSLFKLNASTGAVDCSFLSPNTLEATPTVATPPGGVPTVYLGSLDSTSGSGPFFAINAGNCSLEWQFTGYNQSAGSWNSASYVVGRTGIPMVLFGTDNPDSSVYALNALTGTEIWRYQTYNPVGDDFDVAAGITISPPGKHHFPNGVAYAVNKAGRAYALDLNNGTLLWETDFNALAGIPPGNGEITGLSRSTPALDGSNVIFGFAEGLFDLNGTTGAQIWMYQDPTSTESIASPAIAGGQGRGIVLTGDVGGDLDVVAVTSGTQLYTYQTGGYMTGSPAVSGTNILLASSNGFLYDFAPRGGNDAMLPTTTLTYPASGAVVANPNGNLTVSGNATDPKSVVAVNVAIQASGAAGPWWDAADQSWSPGPVDNAALLGTPGARSTSWSLAFPIPKAGGTYAVTANAESSSGQSDLVGARVGFAANFTTVGPNLETSTAFVAPGGATTLSGSGFGPSEKVRLDLYGKTLTTVTASSSGKLPARQVKVPATAAFGLTSFSALGLTSGRTSTVAVTITNNWDQFGYNAGHSGYEPNDPTLNGVIFPGGNKWIDLAWHFDAGAPIDASPAVVDGVAYVASTAGQLFAVDVTNGGLLWSFSLPDGAAMDGSPAVDPSRGLVMVGADDGTVDAISLSTGLLVWNSTVGGNVSAPVEVNGDVYVASSTGTVAALAESTGHQLWNTTLNGTLSAAPTVNATAKLLFLGDSLGDVLALNLSTGARVWTYGTHGPVRASATDDAGLVFIGSNDHHVYALNQATGALLWKFNAGGDVQDTGALLSSGSSGGLTLYIGSNSGNVDVLHASSGALLFNISIGSGVVGIATEKGVAVFETASGLISGMRATYPLDGWQFATGAGLVTAPVLLDGAVFVTAEDGNLYAFTPNGLPPV